MPDISEVFSAMAQSMQAVLYPGGLSAPSITGSQFRIYPGWPDANDLDKDLAQGIVNISLWPRPGMSRVTTRYSRDWTGTPPAPTMTATVAGDMVTFAGIGSAGMLAAVVEANRPWPLQVAAGQTAAQAATAFQAIIVADRACTVSGAVLTLPNALSLRARCVAAVPEERELRRQIQSIQATIWAPTPVLRDATASALDIWLGATPFLAVAGHSTRLLYAGPAFSDDARGAKLHRRDLFMTAEFPTIQTRISPAVSIPVRTVDDAGGSNIRIHNF